MHKFLFSVWVALCALAAPGAFAMSCEALPSVGVEGGRITAAAWVPATAPAPSGLPAFCKVAIVATPTPDSLINIELWLPDAASWNGRFEGIGNGGYAGTIAAGAPAMAVALRRNFAVASTDMGTAPSGNNNGDALVGHPQK
jgi:feruloyl esterase